MPATGRWRCEDVEIVNTHPRMLHYMCQRNTLPDVDSETTPDEIFAIATDVACEGQMRFDDLGLATEGNVAADHVEEQYT